MGKLADEVMRRFYIFKPFNLNEILWYELLGVIRFCQTNLNALMDSSRDVVRFITYEIHVYGNGHEYVSHSAHCMFNADAM